MTAREARNRRRAEERRQVKLAGKEAKLENAIATAVQSIADTTSVAKSNPGFEDEFARALQIQATEMRDRIRPKAGPESHGFVSHTGPQPSKRAEINRANSLYSTGPKTPCGKLASSRNSLRHGLASGQILIAGEDPAAFEALLHDLLGEHQPANPTEELLVNEMAQSYWLAQRAIRFQNRCFTESGVDEKRLALFLRYQTTHDRSFHKALATLIKLQNSNRQRPAGGFVSQSAAPPQNRGFVPHDAPDASLTQGGDPRFVPQNGPKSRAA